MIRYLFPTVLFLMAALVPVATPTSAAGQPVEVEGRATLDNIAGAWKGREERIGSGEFEWDEVRITSRGPTDLQLGPFDRPPGTEPRGTVTDRKTYRHEYRRALLFEGEKIRFWSTEPILTPDRTRYVRQELTEAFDGRLYKILRERDFGDPRSFRHQGSVLPADREQTCFLVDLKPLFLHFQPFRLNEGFPDQFRVVPGLGVVDNTPCIILKRVKNVQGPVVESLWVDPQQAFCVRRVLRQVGDVVMRQIDVEYDADPTYGPVPKGWKLVEHFHNGEFDRSIDATVTTARLNQDISDDRFDVHFPVDTFVYDATQSVEGREGVEYIVRAEGQRRTVLPEELARVKTADELLRSDTGLAGIERPSRSRLPTLLATGILGAVAALIVWLSVRRMRAH